MSQLIQFVYVGKKPFTYDNVAKSGKVWNGNGDVQEVTSDQAKQLLKFPDQWALVDEADAAAVNVITTTEVTGEDGEAVSVSADAFSKPLEKMSKAELVALAKAKFLQELDASKPKKLLIDAIEEFNRDLEPIANVG